MPVVLIGENVAKTKALSGSLRDRILRKLKASVYVKPGRMWLDIGNEHANAVWGSPKFGVPAGKMFQVAGKKHGGKTAFVVYLAGRAQRKKRAFVIYIDAENSFSANHVKHLGVSIGKKEDDYASDDFYLIYPKLLERTAKRKSKRAGVKFEETGSIFLQSCEFLFTEAEEVMNEVKRQDRDRPIFIIIDSVANLQTEMALELGLTEKNMRSAQDRAQFLSDALPKWVNLGKNMTAWMFFINQIRTKPAKPMENPEYSPGGKALEHNCHVMGQIRRLGKPNFNSDGKVIGLGGYMVNQKNKAGGGSYEQALCSYQVDFSQKNPDKIFRFKEFKKKRG